MRARLVVATATLCVFAVPGSARDIGHEEALRLRRGGELLALEKLLGRAFVLHPDATLLEAELEREDGALVYELEILTADGEVRELEFDARSGTLLSDEAED